MPVPLLLIWAPSWGWVVLANVLLGINQGLVWSTTVIMKIDPVGPARRGLAMGLNEAAGYGALAATAMATGAIAAHAGLRPQPFFLGIAYAALGLGLSALVVRETRDHARLEAALRPAPERPGFLRQPATGWIVRTTSFRTERCRRPVSKLSLVSSMVAIGELLPSDEYPRGISTAAA